MERHVETFSKWYFQVSRIICGIPYQLHWEPGLKIYVQRVKKFPYFCWRLIYILNVVYFLHLLYLFIVKSSIYLADKQYIKLAFHCIWLGAPGTLIINQGSAFFAGEQVIQLTNANVDLIRNLETTHFRSRNPFKRSVQLRRFLIGSLILMMLGFFLLLIPLLLMFQNEIWQLGSHVYRLILWWSPFGSTYSLYLAIPLGLAVDMWQLFGIEATGALNLYANLTFMHTFKVTVQQMIFRKTRPVGHHQSDFIFHLKLLQEDILIYSKLRIVTTLFNNVYGELYIAPITTALVIFVVEGAYMAVRFTNGEETNLFLACFGSAVALGSAGVLVIFTVFMAMVHDFSLKFGENIGRRVIVQRSKVGQRYAKAVRVEAVTSGNFYQVRRITCLTVLGFVANVTGSVLISFN